MPFSSPKWPICPEQHFFGTNHYYYFHLTIGPFHCAKFLKNFCSGSRVMRMCHFWAQNGPFAPKKFLEKIINIIFIYLLAPFIEKKILKNSYSRSRVMRMHHFWAQNDPFAKMRIFLENLLISLVPFFHAYLHAKNQSPILIY